MKKVIVITGGNSGIGKAASQILAKDNDLIILGKDLSKVKKVSKELRCEGYLCDVTNPKSVQSVFQKIIKKYKKVDCLINCAGVWIKGPIEENKPEDIKNTVLVNTFGTMLMANVFVPQFKKQNFGRIINIVSQAGLNAKAERSVYNASKWAITGFTKCLQLELSGFNIGVTGFYPGFIETGLFGKSKDNRTDFSTAMNVGQVANAIVHLVSVEDDLLVNSYEMQLLNKRK